MVRIEGEKLVIEIQSTSPEEMLISISKGLIEVIQAVQASETLEDTKLGGHLFFVLELYKALQLNEDQFKRGLLT
jgi:hypothetical protein